MKKYCITVSVIMMFIIMTCVGCGNSNVESDSDIMSTEGESTEGESNQDGLEADVDADSTGDQDADVKDSEDVEGEVEAEGQTAEKEDAGEVLLEKEYILENSDQVIVSSLDLAVMTLDELRIARNEIYARHGLIFESSDLKEHFEGKDWYEPSVTDADSIKLNYTEQVNVKLISEQECFKGEDTSILASVYSMKSISMKGGYFTVKTNEDSLTSYIPFTESWDYVTTTEVLFEVAEDCEWYICSPLVFHGDYSDAIKSDETEVMKIIEDELEDKLTAEENGDPFDTSMSVMIKVEDGKIVEICQVSA